MANDWGKGLVRGWNAAGWFDAPIRLGGKLAPLLGAEPNEVVVTDAVHFGADIRIGGQIVFTGVF